MSARARARAAQRTPRQEDLGRRHGGLVVTCQIVDKDLHGGSARRRPARGSVGNTVGPPRARVVGIKVAHSAASTPRTRRNLRLGFAETTRLTSAVYLPLRPLPPPPPTPQPGSITHPPFNSQELAFREARVRSLARDRPQHPTDRGATAPPGRRGRRFTKGSRIGGGGGGGGSPP